MSSRSEKIVIYECDDHPPHPRTNANLCKLVPPHIDLTNLSDDEYSFDRKTLILFCEGMVKYLSDNSARKFFSGLVSDLKTNSK